MNLPWLSAGGASGLWRIAIAIFLFVGPLHAAPYSGWPEEWKQTYERFEQYNAARAKYFPRANLDVSPDGKISHSVQFYTGTTSEHLNSGFYTDGRNAIVDDSSPYAENQVRRFPPKRYTAVLLSCGFAGYQYLYPFAWFEAYYPKSTDPKTPYQARPIALRAIEPPHPAEDYWPNERLFQFLDFHVFPRRNPKDIAKENAKVKPSVKLSVTNSGVVERNSLDESLEKLLTWRVYYNGRLIERGSASGVTSFPVSRGPGSYQVFVGVEGPNGFMPVSNFLEFPLFPEKSGLVIFPSATNPERFPDFLTEILPADQRRSIISANPPAKRPEAYYNIGLVYIAGTLGPFKDKDSEDLFYLWLHWAWELNSAMRNNTLSGLDEVKDRPTRP